MKNLRFAPYVAAMLLVACDSNDNQNEVDELRARLNALETSEPPELDESLGAKATQGANRLPEENSDNVWRVAVFPDTQGRDDDNMPDITIDKDGNDLGIEVYHGYDYNNDGIYDGDTYRLNVSDPLNPYIETDAEGQPVEVAIADRKDFPKDFKIIPQPLVEAVTDKMIELDVDLVLAVGDMTEYRAESDYVMWMDKVAAPLRDAEIDIYPIRGNHEIVNGRNWPQWFSFEEEPNERQSVDNVLNGISAYEEGDTFDQGYKLYQTYVGSLLSDKIDSGEVKGFPGFEDLTYYFVEKNTLFIAIDFYFSDLLNPGFNSTWTDLAVWLTDVIEKNGSTVDHVVVFGHEPLSTRNRPQTFESGAQEEYLANKAELETQVEAKTAELEEATAALDKAKADGEPQEDIDTQTAFVASLQSELDAAEESLAELEEPKVVGYDIGQLGHLLLQNQSQPGLADKILNLFTEYQVNYISGHDHLYSRSLIHTNAQKKDEGVGFNQFIVGNASWKSGSNLYGSNEQHETALYVKSFKDAFANTGDGYRIHSGLGKGVSFLVLEFNGRQITSKSYFAEHKFTESDLNLGLRYNYEDNCWMHFTGKYLGGAPGQPACQKVAWVEDDVVTRSTNGQQRVVAPHDNYAMSAKTPEGMGYIGSEMSILDGYNLTFDSNEVKNKNRVELMSELLSLTWFVDENEDTVTDVIWISGNQNQDGSHYDYYGDFLASESESSHYVNRSGYAVNNPTHTNGDGVLKKGTNINASLSGNLDKVRGEGGNRQENWVQRYNDDGLDFADAMAVAFRVPEGVDMESVTLGRFDEVTKTWVPVLRDECFADTFYSQHYSVQYRIVEQGPEGDFSTDGCQQFYWGYNQSSNSIWGHIHTDGRFALIKRPVEAESVK